MYITMFFCFIKKANLFLFIWIVIFKISFYIFLNIEWREGGLIKMKSKKILLLSLTGIFGAGVLATITTVPIVTSKKDSSNVNIRQ